MRDMSRAVAVDFFCGAGGMTNGLIKAGFHVLAGIDNESACCATYIQNKNRDRSRPEYLNMDAFPRSRSHPDGQQTAIAERLDDLIRDYKRRRGYRAVRLVFAICAPCQPFTVITKTTMSEDRQFKRMNDADLLLTMVALIRRFRPDAIICENVEGIGDGERSVLARFKARLGRAGYVFDAQTVNAVKFGVPQNRKRTIGIGFDRKRYSADFEVPHSDPRVKYPVTVGATIGHLPPLAAGEVHKAIPNHRARALNELNLKRISCAPPGGSNAYLADTPYGDLSLGCHRRLAKVAGAPSFTDTYTRMAADDVAPTITTKCMSITNGRFGHFDTTQNRAITPREAALLQTFPPRYVFHPEQNIDFVCTLIGNAVPPKLARFFGRYVIQRLRP